MRRTDLETEIRRLETILSSEANIKDEIRRETSEIALKFGDARRTEIALDTSDLSTEDLIEDKTVLVSITKRTISSGWISTPTGSSGVEAMVSRV